MTDRANKKSFQFFIIYITENTFQPKTSEKG